jgi:hypothetical protein
MEAMVWSERRVPTPDLLLAMLLETIRASSRGVLSERWERESVWGDFQSGEPWSRGANGGGCRLRSALKKLAARRDCCGSLQANGLIALAEN